MVCFYFEHTQDHEYWITLEQNIHAAIESDLVAIHPTLTGNSVPFVPEWKKIKNYTR